MAEMWILDQVHWASGKVSVGSSQIKYLSKFMQRALP
jgi:hypothetical protein